MLKAFLCCFISAVVGVALFFAFTTGIERQEQASCYKVQEYETVYPLYESSTTTASRCKELGVDVYALID